MSQMLSLLKKMRGRLGMYLGVSSIVRLAAFLRGYDLALERFVETRDPFLPAFRDWIHQRFQSSQHSWEETILLNSANEADVVNRFWELFDEFVEKHSLAMATTEPFKANGIGRAPLESQVRDDERKSKP